MGVGRVALLQVRRKSKCLSLLDNPDLILNSAAIGE